MRMIRLLGITAAIAAGPVAAQSVTISGTVRNTQSAGVAGATVTVLRVTTPFGGAELAGTATTDAQGAYAFTVPMGCALQCRVSVSAEGRVVRPDLRTIATDPSGQDFVAALPATLNVRVEAFEDGAPVAGLRPFASYGDRPQPPVVEDLGGGQWRFSGVFPGPLHLCAQSDADAYVGTCNGDQVMPFTNVVSGLTEMAPAEGATQDVVLRLRRGATLTGILTDSYRSTPIASTTIQMALFDFPGTANRSLLLATDADGRYRAPGLPPGAYRLQVSVSSPYYTPMRYPGLECLLPEDCLPNSGSYVSVSGSAFVDNLGFELFPGAVITGRVTAAAGGAPLEDIEVRAYQTIPFGGTLVVASARSGADGRFELANLVPSGFPTRIGTWNARGYVDVGWPAAPCDAISCNGGTALALQPGIAATQYDFALAAGRAIAGAISMPGAPPGGVSGVVEIFRQDGAQMVPLWRGPVEPGATYLTRGFAAGTYFARAQLGPACLVHAQQPCPGPFVAIDPATATPIVLPAGIGTHPGVDFAFPPEPLFANGFE